MKIAVFILCLVTMALAQEKYKSNLDENFDVSEVLSNERLLKSYAQCLLDKGPCTPELKQVKDTLPEALATKCAKCTDKQKQIGKQLATEVKKSYPELWNELISKYDPEGKFQESFKEYLVA